MLKKINALNTLTEKLYEGYYSPEYNNGIPFFKKNVAKKIIEDTNKFNNLLSCSISFMIDSSHDGIVCKDNEFSHSISTHESHMIYTEYGMMKLYNFGEDIIWEC